MSFKRNLTAASEGRLGLPTHVGYCVPLVTSFFIFGQRPPMRRVSFKESWAASNPRRVSFKKAWKVQAARRVSFKEAWKVQNLRRLSFKATRKSKNPRGVRLERQVISFGCILDHFAPKAAQIRQIVQFW